jgi:predicted phosphodiesterase
MFFILSKRDSAMDTIRIVHISDLHFGAKDKKDVWSKLAYFIQTSINPELIFVTGDIVDTSANDDSLKNAKDALDKLSAVTSGPYYICPGNHDRFVRGNRLPWGGSGTDNSPLFDTIFRDHILGLNSNTLKLKKNNNIWDLHALSLDSCKGTDLSARGYIEDNDIISMQNTTASFDLNHHVDLRVVLLHHHLLPVRSEEHKRLGSFDLTSLTCLVNAGSTLEALTTCGVDIALHGHEHAPNWGTYGSLENKGETKVVGSGSATGMKTGEGLDLDRASLNVLELQPDRTVRLKVWKYKSKWEVDREITLFDRESLRKTQLSRHSKYTTKPSSEIIKVITFTEQRDALIEIRFTDWQIDQQPIENSIESELCYVWAYTIKNSTGVPDIQSIRIQGMDGLPWEADLNEDCSLIPLKEKGAYQFSCKVPKSLVSEEYKGRVKYIVLVYKWDSGIVLTNEELDVIGSYKDPLREQGFEFGAIWIDSLIGSFKIMIILPPQYSPKTAEVEIFVQDEKGRRQKTEERSAKNYFRTIAQGIYLLEIPYPLKNTRYIVAWKPIKQSTHLAMANSISKATRKNNIGFKYAEVAFDAFDTTLGLLGSIAFYTLSLNGRNHTPALNLAGCHPFGANKSLKNIIMIGEVFEIEGATVVHPVVGAWWGKRTFVFPEGLTSSSCDIINLSSDEECVLFVPLRYGYTFNPGVCGVLRISLTTLDKDTKDALWSDNEEDIDRALWQLMAKPLRSITEKLNRENLG